jgi:hypothetical protein
MSVSSALIAIPENTSFLQPTKFTFTFPNLPFARYFGQTVMLPGVSTSPVDVETPFATTWRHGDKLQYEQLSITAIIDEDLRVWEETFNWLIALTKPTEFPEYIKYNKRDNPAYYDAVLTINTNANNPNLRFVFHDCHPISLGAIQFNVSDSAENTLTTDITFRYDYFQISRVNG